MTLPVLLYYISILARAAAAIALFVLCLDRLAASLQHPDGGVHNGDPIVSRDIHDALPQPTLADNLVLTHSLVISSCA